MADQEIANPPSITVDWIGGNCPVRAEGTINGKPFYFRARGDHWSLGIGGADPCEDAEWEHYAWYGSWPDAGWMTAQEAEAFLRAAAARYAEGLPGGRLDDDQEKMQAAKARHRELFGRAADGI